jgi:hypothetical protein
MEQFELLTRKVHQAAQQISRLKEKCRKLESQVSLSDHDNSRSRDFMEENSQLRENKKIVISRLEKMLKKLNLVKIPD